MFHPVIEINEVGPLGAGSEEGISIGLYNARRFPGPAAGG